MFSLYSLTVMQLDVFSNRTNKYPSPPHLKKTGSGKKKLDPKVFIVKLSEHIPSNFITYIYLLKTILESSSPPPSFF